MYIFMYQSKIIFNYFPENLKNVILFFNSINKYIYSIVEDFSLVLSKRFGDERVKVILLVYCNSSSERLSKYKMLEHCF